MKYKIIVKGEAQTDFKYISKLDGIDCQDCFTDYIDDNYDGALTGGYLKFKVENNKLISVTTYDSSRKLTSEELEKVSEYTSGQWSDGIGEGFEQQPCYYDDNGEGVYISPWFYGQEEIVEQIEI